MEETNNNNFPREWEIVNLNDDDYFKIVMGQSPPSSTYNYDKSGLPFLQGKAEFGSKFPDPFLYCSKPIKIAKKDSILLSVRAPVGDVNIANSKTCIGRGLLAIETNKIKLNNIFIFYYLNFIKKQINSFSSGSTFKSITKNDLKRIKIFIPDLIEQEKIAEILSTVDNLIEETDVSILKTERLKKGLMQKLLTKGIGHKEFKKTDIGLIPREWEISEIKNISDVFTGKTPPTSKKIYWNGDIPFITPEDMTGYKYVVKTKRNVTEAGARKGSKILLKNTIIVVCIGSTIGKISIIRQKSIVNQQINAVVCKENVFCEYVYYAILFRTSLLKNQSGIAAVPIIKKSLFEIFKIPIPGKFSEQEKIAEILSTVDMRLQLFKEKKQKLQRIKKGLMNNLLTGKIRVKA
ncbi:MAG TPA: hypothetical protein DCS12_10665 [Clostridiales bacterium]|nr:hypothetical protein [Clostridiales bacterium]